MPELLLPLPAQPPQITPVCVVLVDLSGSTALARTLPLAHYMALMTEFVQVMILSFEARGGTVLQHQGDAVLGYWPAERTVDACRVALEAHERAARLGLARLLGAQLRLRAGVAAGDVIVGLVGGQPSAYGLPVNYAQRLCDAARPGETLACASLGHSAVGQSPVTQSPVTQSPVTQSPVDGSPGPAVAAVRCEALDLPGFGAGCQINRLEWLEQPGLQTRMKSG